MAVAQRQEFKIISRGKRLSTTELAAKIGKSVGRIRQIAKNIPEAENESGRGWSFPVSAIGFIKSHNQSQGQRKRPRVTISNTTPELSRPTVGKLLINTTEN